MFEFIGLTLSIALGIVLAMVIMCVIAFNPVVIKLYTKGVMKTMNKMFEVTEESTKDQ